MSPPEEVLVTGAAGFIGRHLVRRLAAGGCTVTAVDLDEAPSGFDSERVRYRRLDVRDTSELEPLLPSGGDVYHLASVHLEVGASESVFEEVNVRAAADLTEACSRTGVRRMVHTSSVGVYGHVENPPAREDSPKNPQTPYERTKLAGERAVREQAEKLGMDVIVLRPAWVYGQGCPRTSKLARAVDKGRFFYIGGGENLRHPLYIDDMLNAFRLAVEAPASLAGRVYLIGGPRYLPLREMVGIFARVLGVSEPRIHVPRSLGWAMGLLLEAAFALSDREPPFSRRSLSFFENNNAFDTTAARRDLGFAPRVSLKDGLRRIFDSERPMAVL